MSLQSFPEDIPMEYDSYDNYTWFDSNLETLFPVFQFEKTVYLYVWEILVCVVCLLNIAVLVVLLRQKMRNTTNVILSAIAVSDSLTGVVTLPSYIAVYSKQYPASSPAQDDVGHHDFFNDTKIGANIDEVSCAKIVVLSSSLCRNFMISKFFISHSFHTASIWLTLLLAIHRFVYVSFPFRAKSLFTIRYTACICLIIIVCSPSLHVFHLFDDKAKDIFCQWDRETDRCGPGCVYIGMMFSLKHFIPSILMILFTSLFVHQLAKTREQRVQHSNSIASPVLGALKTQEDASQRVSLIVTVVLVVFLIPEVPYGVFLLYSIISWQTDNQVSLETNRMVQTVYEITMLLSFAANFGIYAVLNRKFRQELCQVFSKTTNSNVSTSSASGGGRFKTFSTFSHGSNGGEENAAIIHDSDIELEIKDNENTLDNTKEAE